MFNSSILEVCIGLIFIFMLYSLLATSISEAIASLFALRARTLRKGIIKGMLSNSLTQNTSVVRWVENHTLYLKDQFREGMKENTWLSIYKALRNLFHAVWRIITGTPYDYKPGTPGGDFYLHPIIKSYGSSRRFSVPSYISSSTFYTVFTDVLEQYFLKNLKVIADANALTEEEALNLPQITKIDYLIKYIALNNNVKNADIDTDTLKIIHVYLKESYHNPAVFAKKIEDWFNTTMDRVSGWYKRQIQYMLFVLGLLLAITFNINIIKISNKLSEDRAARIALVEMALKAPEQYSNDPRVQRLETILRTDTPQNGQTAASELKTIHDSYVQSMDDAKKLLEGDIKESNNLVSLGWGDYGLKKDSAIIVEKYKGELKKIHHALKKESITIPPAVKDTINYYQQLALERLYDNHFFRLKAKHVFTEGFKGSAPVGFLLFAFGVCLGAPFWFDLLQKIVKLRASGKREDGTGTTQADAATTLPPVQVNIKTSNAEEAAG